MLSHDAHPSSPYDSVAHAWAQRIRSGQNPYYEFFEKPSMYAKLPPLDGKDVLCVGCGSGEECAELSRRGARRVVGIDNSRGLLEIARQSYPELEFQHMDMNALDFGDAEFDFVYSSLALHYIADWTPALKVLYRALKPGGRFLLSVHHPIWWAGEPLESNDNALVLGHQADENGCTAFGNYLNRHEKKVRLYNSLEVTVVHKPLSEIFAEIRASGFSVLDFIEPVPQLKFRFAEPGFYQVLKKIPIFLILELGKV